MYWWQAAVALAAALGTGWAVGLTGRGTLAAAAAALVAYIIVRWILAWAFRVRYWYRNGTRGAYHEWCPNCDARRHRLGGDWLLTCRRCGWRPGPPVVRWITRSVPVRQLRRTIAGPRLVVVVLAVAVIAVNPISLTVALPTVGPSDPIDIDSTPTPAPTGASTSTPTPQVDGTPHPDVGDTPDDPGTGLNETQIERAVHQFVNQKRTERGLQSISYDTDLAAVARYHSQDMAIEQYFAHTSPDGETMLNRYERFGYQCRVSTGGNSYLTGAENIAYRYAYQTYQSDRGLVSHDGNETAIAQGIVTEWMNSPPHRENILTPEWNNEGIGIYVVDWSDGVRVYATQNFC